MLNLIPFISIVEEYQRVAVFRAGRIAGFRGPGIVMRMPFIERFVLVDSRIVTVDVKPQECMSKDNVPIRVNAVVYFRVEHPDKAIVNVVDYRNATIEVAQTTLRTVIGQLTLDEALGEMDRASSMLRSIIDKATDEWGVKVSRVEIKDIQIPDELKRAMAKEAEAERERRAMVIRAAGEKEAAQQLAEAARILETSPYGFQLRYLQTLLQVSETGNTIVFAPDSANVNAMSTAMAQRAQLHGVPQGIGKP